MSTATTNALQLYDKKYLSLRSRFLTQFGNAEDADDCLQKLREQFSHHLEYSRWETNAELKKVLMILAGKVSSEKLAAKQRQRENSLLNRIRHQAAQALRDGVDFRQLAVQLVSNLKGPRLPQLSSLPR